MVTEVHANVKESPAIHDETVAEHLLLDPVELVVVRDLHVQLGQRVGHITVAIAPGLEAHICTARGLFPEDRVHGREDGVNGQSGTALGLKGRQVRLVPLIAAIVGVTLFGRFNVLKVTVVTGSDVSVPLTAGDFLLFAGGHTLSTFSYSHITHSSLIVGEAFCRYSPACLAKKARGPRSLGR